MKPWFQQQMQDFKRNFLFGVHSKMLLFSLYIINYESVKLFKWVCRGDVSLEWTSTTIREIWLVEQIVSIRIAFENRFVSHRLETIWVDCS